MTTQNPFLIQQPKAELPLVQKFQSHSNLASIRLKHFQADSGDLEKEPEGKLRLDLRHAVRLTKVENRIAYFDVALEMEATIAGELNVKLFGIKCCLETVYSLAKGFTPTDEQIAAFSRGNVLFHCWPYLREFVQNTTWRMGLILPPLPLLRIVPESLAQKPAVKDAEKSDERPGGGRKSRRSVRSTRQAED